MKKIIKCLVMLGCLCLMIPIVFAEDRDPVREVVEHTVQPFMQRNAIPGAAVELYVDGKPYAYQFGYANREKKLPVTQDTIFELGSVSKLMTSFVLAKQVDFAKVQLDDPIKKYSPSLSPAFEGITFKNLATHTSGLPFNFPAFVKTKSGLAAHLATIEPPRQAGELWIYSNAGMGVLGNVLENITQKNLDALYQKYLLKPLGMRSLAVIVPEGYQPFYAQGYNSKNLPVKASEAYLLQGASGVKASAADMQRFLSAAIGLPGTPQQVFYPMRMTQTAYVKLSDRDQGLGWDIHRLTADYQTELLNVSPSLAMEPKDVEEIYSKPIYSGDTLIDKTGATNGFRAYIAVLPNKKAGIVLLTNKYVSNNELVKTARELLFALADAVVDHPDIQQQNKDVA